MNDLSIRIDNFIGKQFNLSSKEYLCRLDGKMHKLSSNIGREHYQEGYLRVNKAVESVPSKEQITAAKSMISRMQNWKSPSVQKQLVPKQITETVQGQAGKTYIRHRTIMVKPGEAGYEGGISAISGNLKEMNEQLNFISLNAHKFSSFAPTQKANFADSLAKAHEMLGKLGRQMTKEVREYQESQGGKLMTHNSPDNPIGRARKHLLQAVRFIKENQPVMVEKEISDFARDYQEALNKYENGAHKKVIQKQVKFSSESEAQKYGVKLPVNSKLPKIPPNPKIKDPTMPKQDPKKPSKVMGVAEEVGRQLTPTGPGYHSPEDVVRDVKESQRLANKITGFVNRKKETE